MPKPLVILEQYFITGSKSFVAKHIKELKELGYSKFLFEMNSELTKNQVKRDLQGLLNKFPSTSPMHRGSSALLNLINALEQHGLDYEFIDPETREQAQRNVEIQQAVFSSKDDVAIRRMHQATEENTARRDKIMAEKVLQETKAHHGGVICMTAFLHQPLVQALHQSQYDFRFALFTDSTEDTEDPNFNMIDMNVWKSFYDGKTKMAYYKCDVTFFDMAYDNSLSFEMVASACGLTETRALAQDKLPEVGKAFDSLLPGCQYRVDEQQVVSASKRVSSMQDTVTCFVKAGLGIRFFATPNQDGTTQITVPGINLEDSRDSIDRASRAKGFGC